MDFESPSFILIILIIEDYSFGMNKCAIYIPVIIIYMILLCVTRKYLD
jgi:hypothetical protein